MALPHSTDIFKYPPRFQFGQAGAPCGGSSCCTDTCIQMIIDYYKERHYSLRDIRYQAQRGISIANEAACTGISGPEVLNGLKNLGLPNNYKIAYGINATFVKDKAKIGPVIVGVHYGSYPAKAGKCRSRSGVAEVSGRTDCPFTGAHAVLVIGSTAHKDSKGNYLHTDVYVRDPDHNSPSRPEKPAYDRFKLSQLSTAMFNLPRYTAFSKTYCVYPTKKKVL